MFKATFIPTALSAASPITITVAATSVVTPAIPVGQCPNCFWTIFHEFEHHCPTDVHPLIVFNNVGGRPRGHAHPGEDILPSE